MAEWQTRRVSLVLPTTEMYVYNDDLAALELCYADFAIEVARADEVECFVPDEAHAEKMARLTGLDIETFPQASLPDIWIRDYAPLRGADGWVKFRYRPAYSKDKLNRNIDAAAIDLMAKRGLELDLQTLALEGGNLVHNGAGVAIASEKLLAQNRGIPRSELIACVERALGLERLVLVPTEPQDRTGHVDGMLRFADEDLLVVNDYGEGNAGSDFGATLAKRLDRELPDVRRVEVPYLWSAAKHGGWYDVRGNYANFVMTRNRVYVPCYGLPADERACEIFRGLFGDRARFVDARAISRYGGSLHCISWNL
jgi:agmatine/peptidylarginine deiminase